MLPTMPDGTKLMALQVGERPERYVYGDYVTLAWLQEQLLAREAEPMPTATDMLVRMPRWTA